MKPSKAEEKIKNEIQQAKEKLLRCFRKWYGCLSVKELAANPILVREIEDLEKLVLIQGV